jgi:hypothetical protein
MTDQLIITLIQIIEKSGPKLIGLAEQYLEESNK